MEMKHNNDNNNDDDDATSAERAALLPKDETSGADEVNPTPTSDSQSVYAALPSPQGGASAELPPVIPPTRHLVKFRSKFCPTKPSKLLRLCGDITAPHQLDATERHPTEACKPQSNSNELRPPDAKKQRQLDVDKRCFELVSDFLHSKDGCDLRRPRLVVNVVGHFKPPSVFSVHLKSVVKSLFCMTKNTWVLNEGYATPFNSVVNEALAELNAERNSIENEELNVQTTSLGICTWRNITGRERIEKGDVYDLEEVRGLDGAVVDDDGNNIENVSFDNENQSFPLCENNTHFIAVDQTNSNGDTFRKQFFKNLTVPRVTLLFGGGKRTLRSLVDLLEAKIPCIVVKGSGGLADALASIIVLLQNSASEVTGETIESVKKTINISYPSSIHTKSEFFTKCLTYFKSIVVTESQNLDQIEIHRLVLDGFLQIGKENLEKDALKLCQKWDCLNHASKLLNDIHFSNEDLADCMVSYMKRGNVKFVEMLAKYKPYLFNKFESKHFRELYNSDKITLNLVEDFCEAEIEDIHGINHLAEQILSITDEKRKEMIRDQDFDFLFHLFIWSALYKHYSLANYFWRFCDFPIANALIASSFLKSMMTLPLTDEKTNEARSVYANYYEDQASLLLANCFDRSQTRTKFLILRTMESRGNLSILQIATKDDENANFLANPVCISHLDNIWQRCTLSDWGPFFYRIIACFAFFTFLAGIVLFSSSTHPSVRLTGLPLAFAALLLFIVMISFKKLKFRQPYSEFKAVLKTDEDLDKKMLYRVTRKESLRLLQLGISMDVIHDELHPEDSPNFLRDCLTNSFVFLDSPETKFTLHVCSFFLYLSLYAYLILSADPNFSRETPSQTELLVIGYWISFCAHEFKQFYHGDVDKNQKGFSTGNRFKEYLDSFWNRIDIFLFVYMMAILIYRGTIYAFASFTNSDSSFISVLNLYSIYFVLWFLRILQIFAVSKTLGPKLIMIRLMLDDVGRILLYILIFSISYSVWLKALVRTVSPDFLENRDVNSTSVASVVDFLWNVHLSDIVYFLDDLMAHPFWHLFGESFIEDFEEYLPDESVLNRANFTAIDLDRYQYRVIVIKLAVPFIRIIYVLITVVLLLNLMIAIFQYSIDRVQSKADKNWNIYRKNVIFEYYKRAILPIPLSLFIDIPAFCLLIFNKTCCRKRKIKISYSNWGGERFTSSTLHLRALPVDIPRDGVLIDGGVSKTNGINTTTSGDQNSKVDVERTAKIDNPIFDWVEFIRNWEKLLHQNLNKDEVENEESYQSNDSREKTNESNKIVMRLIEIKDEMTTLKKDVEILKKIAIKRKENESKERGESVDLKDFGGLL